MTEQQFEAAYRRARDTFQGGYAIGTFWPTWEKELRAALRAALNLPKEDE